jgi:hypothetical protein
MMYKIRLQTLLLVFSTTDLGAVGYLTNGCERSHAKEGSYGSS